MPENTPTIVLHEYLTPRLERLYPAFLSRIAPAYEEAAKDRNEHIVQFADQLVAFLKVSAYAASSSHLDYTLVSAGDTAEIIFSKFDVFSDTAHYDHFKQVLREVEARFEAISEDETRPVGEQSDPNS